MENVYLIRKNHNDWHNKSDTMNQKSWQKTILSFSLLAGIAIPSIAFADDKPPSNVKPLSQIIQNLERKGYSPIVNVNYDDDDGWEIKAYRNNEKRKLKVNPVSGDISSDKKYD